jgi:hypothetical protein
MTQTSGGCSEVGQQGGAHDGFPKVTR